MYHLLSMLVSIRSLTVDLKSKAFTSLVSLPVALPSALYVKNGALMPIKRQTEYHSTFCGKL